MMDVFFFLFLFFFRRSHYLLVRILLVLCLTCWACVRSIRYFLQGYPMGLKRLRGVKLLLRVNHTWELGLRAHCYSSSWSLYKKENTHKKGFNPSEKTCIEVKHSYCFCTSTDVGLICVNICYSIYVFIVLIKISS